MVLDEPFEGLDDLDARALTHEVRRAQSAGVLVVISHQDLDHAGATIHLSVKDGRVVSGVNEA
jgi:ABC-type uncharacterized transport system ATPase subunit